MKKFKKIYLEITNICNLNCKFCIQNYRKEEFMSKEKFIHVLNAIKEYTDYLYFHILGEPLMHPKINEFIDLASKDFKINITTNGYLIDKIKDNSDIRQLNISLHSFDDQVINFNEYISKIFEVTDELIKNNTIINYRLWANSKYKEQFVNVLNNKYNVKINNENNFTLSNNVYIDFDSEFEWPDLNNEVEYNNGTCIGLKEHIGILVDGTVVPCCLDTKGIINLGNIFEETLETVLCKEKTINIIIGFDNNKKCENLCRKCNFYTAKKN